MYPGVGGAQPNISKEREIFNHANARSPWQREQRQILDKIDVFRFNGEYEKSQLRLFYMIKFFIIIYSIVLPEVAR